MNVQIPFADARQFVRGETGRLRAPTWPLPDPDGEFVRSCGRVAIRRRGGIAPWSGEGTYCDARRALRFPDSLGRMRFPAPEHDVSLACVYRRYLSTGTVMARLDIGLRPIEPRYEPPARSQDFMEAAIRACATVPVRVGGVPGDPTPLVASTSQLARHVLAATTAVTALDRAERWWLSAGRPMILAEYRVDRFHRVPRPRKEVPLAGSLALRLSHFYMRLRGTDVGVWLLGYGDETDREAMRRMRVHLSRLHAEREGLRKILAQIARGRLTVSGNDEAERLQRYLNDSCRAVTQVRWYGNAQHPLLEAAYDSDALVSEGDRESLLGEVDQIRRSIASRLRRIAEPAQPSPSAGVARVERAETVIIAASLKELDMSDKRVEVSSEGPIQGVFGSGNIVQESFQNNVNRIQGADVSDELRDLLLQLTSAVEGLVESAEDPTVAEQAKRDLDAFTAEATSANPRHQMLKSLGDGLLKVGSVAGAVGVPIVKLVGAILALV